VSAPADAQQPSARRGDWIFRIGGACLHALVSPTVEPRSRGVGIDSPDADPVLARVLEHVSQREPHFLGSAQDVSVESIAEHAPAASPDAIQASRDPDAQALHPERQRIAILGFHDQVDVIALDRVVDQPDLRILLRGCEHPLELLASRVVAQARKSRAQPQGDVHRMTRRERRSRAVRDPCSGTSRLPASARARSAPGRESEFVLTGLGSPPHAGSLRSIDRSPGPAAAEEPSFPSAGASRESHAPRELLPNQVWDRGLARRRRPEAGVVPNLIRQQFAG
jgi:hypothetical protein